MAPFTMLLKYDRESFGTTMPIRPDVLLLMYLAAGDGWYPSVPAISMTLAATSGSTLVFPFRTLETVAVDTPESFAISFIPGRFSFGMVKLLYREMIPQV